MSIEQRTIESSELKAICTELEALSLRLVALEGDDWQRPEHSLYAGSRRAVGKAVSELKDSAFTLAWRHFKSRAGLRNAADTKHERNDLHQTFMESEGLDFDAIKAYFDDLQPSADKLAMHTILANAKNAVPYEFRSEPDKLVHKSTVKLKLYRDSWNQVSFGSYSRETLAALDKLGNIVVHGAAPSEAMGGWLTRTYGHRYGEDVGGKRETGGPFVSARSFKNGRFDLVFKSPAQAKVFAHALVGESAA